MEFADIQSRHIAESTKENYRRRQTKFIDWLRTNYEFVCFENDMLFLETVVPDMINEYIFEESVHHGGIRDGKLKTHSTAEAVYSAIINLFNESKVRLPPGFREV